MKIIFNKTDKIYHPGDLLGGRVEFLLPSVTKIKKVQLKLKGQAESCVVGQESYQSDGETKSRTITQQETILYFKKKIILAGGKGKLKLPAGLHIYNFSLVLPHRIPSTFHDSSGSIQYYAKAKIAIPWTVNPKRMEYFFVKNLLNLNQYPDLKFPYIDEKTETFYSFFCNSGLLTIAIRLPKTGFAKNEPIPIAMKINNASSVTIEFLSIYLERKINFKAKGLLEKKELKLTVLRLGSLGKKQSRVFHENLVIPIIDFPNLENCYIITINHQLRIKADASGLHRKVNFEIPLTIGDIPLYYDENAASAPCIKNQHFVLRNPQNSNLLHQS